MSTLKVNKIENPSTSDGGLTIDNSGDVEFLGDGGIKVPQGTTAQRPTGAAGLIRYNTSTENPGLEYWAADDFAPKWKSASKSIAKIPEVYYLVIGGGGGGGGAHQGGGGGAGGYRTSWGTGNVSGGLSPVEDPIQVTLGASYTLEVGAGGSGGQGVAGGTASLGWGGKGGDSQFASIISFGGGGGGTYQAGSASAVPTGQGSIGSSGGAPNVGSAVVVNANSPTATQGFRGGNRAAIAHSPDYCGTGGGGAGGPGEDQTTLPQLPRDGGVGIESDITGTDVFRAGGGGGGRYYSSGNAGTEAASVVGLGGNGGGGNGGHEANSQQPTAGTANTGGGGGAGGTTTNDDGEAGGSGVVILRGPSGLTATFSAGVTVNGTTTTTDQAVSGTVVGDDLVWVVTSASGDSVTFGT